jgi:hypothetical protein
MVSKGKWDKPGQTTTKLSGIGRRRQAMMRDEIHVGTGL